MLMSTGLTAIWSVTTGKLYNVTFTQHSSNRTTAKTRAQIMQTTAKIINTNFFTPKSDPVKLLTQFWEIADKHLWHTVQKLQKQITYLTEKGKVSPCSITKHRVLGYRATDLTNVLTHCWQLLPGGQCSGSWRWWSAIQIPHHESQNTASWVTGRTAWTRPATNTTVHNLSTVTTFMA